MNWKKWLGWTIAACLTPFAILLVAQWTSPWWLDQGAVRGQVTRIIASVSGGAAKYDRIDIRVFPRPKAIVSGGELRIPGVVDVEARSVTAAIRLFPLLIGKVKPYEVRLIAPRVRLVLADTAKSPAKKASAPFSVAAADTTVRAAVKRIASAMPGLTLAVDDGRLELLLGGRAPMLADHLNVEADVSSDAVALEISFDAERLERFEAKFNVSPADLTGDGGITITGAQVPRLGELMGAGSSWPVDTATVDLRVALKLNGLRDARATVAVSAPRIAMHFGKGQVAASGFALDATARTAGDSIAVTLRRLVLATPKLSATGALSRSATGEMRLEAQVGDLDLATLQGVANGLAPGVSSLQGLPVTVTGGTATALTLHSRANGIADLFALPAMDITGEVHGADVTVTAFRDLPVRDASVTARLAHGVLTAQSIRASAEGLPAHDGQFRIDLMPAVSPLSGAITVDVDLARALALAPRYLPPSVLDQLKHVTQLKGSVVATVSLSGNVNTIVPGVTATDLRLSARYDRIPFPVRIARGTVTYTSKAIAANGLGGFVGQSSFDGLAARVSLTGATMITATQGSVQLALPELFAWARTQPDLAKPLDSVRSVTGSLSLSVQRLALPLDSVKRLTFVASATPHALVVDAPHYAPKATLDGGAILITERSAGVADVSLSALDARLAVSGSIGDYRSRLDEAKGSAHGTIGPEALDSAYARGRLPSTLRLSGALDIASASAEWRRDGPQTAAGSIAVRGGPTMDFTLRQKGEVVDIERARLHDAVTDVTISGTLEGAHFRAGCDGHVDGSSIDRIFVEPPLRLERFDCAFKADGDVKKPKATVANGTLTGTRLTLPPVLPVPVTIDRFDLDARGSALEIRALRVSSGASRVDVTGSVKDVGDRFVVDADIRGDTVIIPVLARAADSSSAPETNAAPAAPSSRETAAQKQSKFYRSLRDIPASGVVRVNIGLLKILHFEIAPLVAAASIEGTRVRLGLSEAALCGVALAGGITLEPDSIDVALTMLAKNIPIERTITCLSNKRIDITGTANVNGAYSASAPMGTLRDRVRGTLTMTATKGRINKFDALADALKVVNATQVLVGQASDLGTKGMAYTSAMVQLELRGLRLDVKEFSLDASGFEAAAHGTVDFSSGKMDITALVAPIKTANWVISHIPLIRDIFGGTVLAVPVQVGGTIDKPKVVPLGVEAVGSRLFGILGNTLKLPTKLVPAEKPPAAKDTTTAAPAKP